MPRPGFVALAFPPDRSDAEIAERARAIREELALRRSVRSFSSRPVSREVIEDCLRAAGTAPSGANQQPWHFVAVSDPHVKRRIRQAAEAEEREFYERRAPDEWLAALAPLGTNADKPFLEIAPWLIAVFVQPFALRPDGSHAKHYYAVESVGLATGLMLVALHHAGLATLTHTPSPMAFLNRVLGRPGHERPFVLVVAGHPAHDAEVPDLRRKALRDIATFVECAPTT